jgi:hypothetical protein
MTWFVEHIHRDGTTVARVPVSGSQLRIGRALDNDLVIDDAHCAAYHACLTIDVDGHAVLEDLNTRNGITPQRGSRAARYAVHNDAPYRLGLTSIRIRHSAWPLSPELALSLRAMWPFALAALAVVVLYTAWKIWLGDVNEKSPPYLYGLFGVAAGLSVWSGMYALLGRLIGGVERFFTHLLVACCGYMIVTLADSVLQAVSFATAWLWPVRIEQYVTILLVALLVRAHLRVADPRHWPTLRWAVGLVAVSAMLVPLAQLWISSQRLTNIQTLDAIEHPALRLAQPVSITEVTQSANALRERVDTARTKDVNGDDSSQDED